MRTGFAHLPLHSGKAPRWLFNKMVRLAREIVCHITAEYGASEVLVRLSDPFWFQAFGCVLGFDWHSSGVTTTTCGAIKEGIRGLEKELGLFATGGKGASSRKTPVEIMNACDYISQEPENLIKASRLSAKFNDSNSMARRYHWLSSRLNSFVNEPHSAICCDAKGNTLDLVASDSEQTRHAITELASQPDRGVLRDVERLPNLILPHRHQVATADINPKYLKKVLLSTYDLVPRNFEELLCIQGVGAKTLRALTLVAELIYGTRASTRDPARFSFAHGGKDGTPFPVDRRIYERTITVLHDALAKSKVDYSEKIRALKRLAAFDQNNQNYKLIT